MIKSVNDCDTIVLLMRQTIAEQAELDLDCVLNGETHQGAELGRVVNVYDEQEHLISSDIVPFSTSDTFIVFDLTEDTEKSKSQVLSDNTIDAFAFYRMTFIIYGDYAGTVSQKLRARMTTAKVRQALEAQGVHIESFEAVGSQNEYINNVYWQRKDLEMLLSVRYNFEPYSVDTNFERIGEFSSAVDTDFARVEDKRLILSRQSKVVINANLKYENGKLIFSKEER